MAANGTNVINKRDMKRQYLIYYLRVFNRNTGEVIGHVVDITQRGIMIMRDSPIEPGGRYSLRIRWRDNSGKLKIADFDAECRWCRPDVNPDFYGAGFAINPTNPTHSENIAHLIEDLAMPEGKIEGID